MINYQETLLGMLPRKSSFMGRGDSIIVSLAQGSRQPETPARAAGCFGPRLNRGDAAPHTGGARCIGALSPGASQGCRSPGHRTLRQPLV